MQKAINLNSDRWNMDISQLYDETIEDELVRWLQKHADAVEVLNNIEQLFAKLRETTVVGDLDEFVSLKGPVHIGKGTRIHSHVEIDGPVIIGENVSIRSGAQIRNCAYIGSDCVVGHSADIKRSLCLNGAKMQDGTFVGDSVLGAGVRVGSGAILANRKFNQGSIKYANASGVVKDSGREFFGSVLGKYVRLGANVVLSPGTTIGEHTWVGSGCVLHGTFPSDQLITVKQDIDIRAKDRIDLRSGRGEYEHI